MFFWKSTDEKENINLNVAFKKAKIIFGLHISFCRVGEAQGLANFSEDYRVYQKKGHFKSY